MFTLYSYVLKPNKCKSLLFITFLKLPDSLTHHVLRICICTGKSVTLHRKMSVLL
jgi:hypothetical protein